MDVEMPRRTVGGAALSPRSLVIFRAILPIPPSQLLASRPLAGTPFSRMCAPLPLPANFPMAPSDKSRASRGLVSVQCGMVAYIWRPPHRSARLIATIPQSGHRSEMACGAVLPDTLPEDLRETTRTFYRLFYHVEPTEPQLDTLIAWSKGQAPSRQQPARRSATIRR